MAKNKTQQNLFHDSTFTEWCDCFYRELAIRHWNVRRALDSMQNKKYMFDNTESIQSCAYQSIFDKIFISLLSSWSNAETIHRWGFQAMIKSIDY